MTSRLTEIVVDCRDPRLMATFWCAVLNYHVVYETTDDIEIAPWEPSLGPAMEGHEAALRSPSLLFERVPEGKSVKNRVHLDVSPTDCTQAEEVERVLALGARHVDIGQGTPSWVVLSDPEDNEFCILRVQAPGS